MRSAREKIFRLPEFPAERKHKAGEPYQDVEMFLYCRPLRENEIERKQREVVLPNGLMPYRREKEPAPVPLPKLLEVGIKMSDLEVPFPRVPAGVTLSPLHLAPLRRPKR